MPFPCHPVPHGSEGSAWARSLGVPLSDLGLLCGSIDGGEVRCFIDAIFGHRGEVVRCFIDAIFGHSLEPGVSTRARFGAVLPPNFSGRCFVLLMRYLSIVWGPGYPREQVGAGWHYHQSLTSNWWSFFDKN